MDDEDLSLNERMAISRKAVLEHLDVPGREGYSRGLKDALGLPLKVGQVGRLLVLLEREGHLISRIQDPPHEDLPNGGGMSRRYFRKAAPGELTSLTMATEMAERLDKLPRDRWPGVLAEWLRSVRPTRAFAADGAICDVCVVCGTLLLPGAPPHCDGHDPEEVEDAELHIPRSLW